MNNICISLDPNRVFNSQVTIEDLGKIPELINKVAETKPKSTSSFVNRLRDFGKLELYELTVPALVGNQLIDIEADEGLAELYPLSCIQVEGFTVFTYPQNYIAVTDDNGSVFISKFF